MSFTTTELIAYTVCCASMVVAVALIIAPYLAASPERRQIRPLAGKSPEKHHTPTPEDDAAVAASITRYQDTPMTWPGPVLPPSDAGLCGLARRDATAHDWSAWRDYSRRATGGDDESGEPWRAGE